MKQDDFFHKAISFHCSQPQTNEVRFEKIEKAVVADFATTAGTNIALGSNHQTTSNVAIADCVIY